MFNTPGVCKMKANDLVISYLNFAQLKCVHGFCEIGQNGTYVICHACTHIIYGSVLFLYTHCTSNRNSCTDGLMVLQVCV
jgi:hypothetical protein